MKGSNPLFAVLGGGLDLTSARWVEIVWDETARQLRVNTAEHGCVLRAYNVEAFHLRQSPAPGRA
jgi:hypothetical protein